MTLNLERLYTMKPRPANKRSASYFDPVCLICTVVLQAKLFFKAICNLRSDWDTPVTEGFPLKWHTVNPRISPRGLICMRKCLHGGLIEEGGLIRGWGLMGKIEN